MVLNVAGAPAGAPAHLRALGAPRAYFNRLSLHGSARHLAALRPRILTAVDTTTAGTSTTAKEREGDPGAPGHANHEHGRPRVGKADKIPSPPNGKAAQALFQSALNSLDLIEATPQHASDEEYEVIVEEVLSAVSVEPGAAAQAYGQANFEVRGRVNPLECSVALESPLPSPLRPHTGPAAVARCADLDADLELYLSSPFNTTRRRKRRTLLPERGRR